MCLAPSLVLLEKVDISHLPYVTDAAVAVFLTTCGKLTEMQCEELPQVTGRRSICLEAASLGLSGLKILSLKGCHSLCDEAASEVWRRAPGLKELSLAGCENITDAALRRLASTSLQRLSISYCPKITDSAVSLLNRYLCVLASVLVDLLVCVWVATSVS